ncbi:MAG: 1,4-dihydroxy-2-naphthoate polyprenyltransferase [Anaerolineae bacterium]|nr:1,4-dihydroxy-2-naphthoate polyprenyltransferase [Anaerolineae bacterium]
MANQAPVSRLTAWRLGIRPKTLPASVSGVVVGIALAIAGDAFAALPALAALAGALLLQITVNLANDYQDYVKGTDVPERTGPTRVAAGGLMPLSELRTGIVLVLALDALVGLYLALAGGWPILALGVAAILSALAYSGGPFPLGYHGLGDLFVFFFFGLGAVCGTYYVQALALTPAVVVAAVPVGALTVAILVVNNYRDYKTDRQTGKRTLAVLLGPAGSRREYVALLIVAYATPFGLWLAGSASPWVLLPTLTLPLAIRLTRFLYRTPKGPTLNQALAGTASLDLLFSLLLSAGILL